MLRPEQYGLLFAALKGRGIELINDPEACRRCHYLPGWYAALEEMTPHSVWLETGSEVSIDRVVELLAGFGSTPVVLKDFVRSRKHEWQEACFIPSASGRAAVERVVRRFIELQSDDLAGGLVFREFVDLKKLGHHPKSGMPLTREFRLFFANHKLVGCFPYWDDVEYGSEDVPIEQFNLMAHALIATSGLRQCSIGVGAGRLAESSSRTYDLGGGRPFDNPTVRGLARRLLPMI